MAVWRIVTKGVSGFGVFWVGEVGGKPVDCGPMGDDVPQELAVEWVSGQAKWFDQVEVDAKIFVKLPEGAKA